MVIKIEALVDILTQVQVLPVLADLLGPGQELYLVGGAPRDVLLGREVGDFDFATPGDPTSLARTFAREIGGHWFFLDEERRQSRVVRRRGEGTVTYDFAPFRAATLRDDLRLRDFTINALALPLHSGAGLELLDPCDGIRDLCTRRLRGCSPGVFEDDPLRVLKGIRHSRLFGFEIEEETAQWMRGAAVQLPRIAPERIRAELGVIFNLKSVDSSISLMQSLNVLDPLFGPATGCENAGFPARCEEVLGIFALEEAEKKLLDENIEEGISRGALLKWAAFGRAHAGEELRNWGGRFKLGRRAAAIFSLLSTADRRALDEISLLPPGRPRAVWAADRGRNSIEFLLFLPVLGTGSPAEPVARVRAVLRDYLQHAVKNRVPDLVSGDWVRENLDLPPGPVIGKALESLRKEEIAGRVLTPEEGQKFLKSFVEKWIDNP